MVQMKHILKPFVPLLQTIFISHMVQMKQKWLVKSNHESSLIYIPHGSDETNCRKTKTQVFYKIYIPHGSDETPNLSKSEFIRLKTFIYNYSIIFISIFQMIKKAIFMHRSLTHFFQIYKNLLQIIHFQTFAYIIIKIWFDAC